MELSDQLSDTFAICQSIQVQYDVCFTTYVYTHIYMYCMYIYTHTAIRIDMAFIEYSTSQESNFWLLARYHT